MHIKGSPGPHIVTRVSLIVLLYFLTIRFNCQVSSDCFVLIRRYINVCVLGDSWPATSQAWFLG